MSLDIILRKKLLKTCHHCGNDYEGYTDVFETNITHNLSDMAYACGLYEAMWTPHQMVYPEHGQGVVVGIDLVDQLERGLLELSENPDRYNGYNPENGWGNYDVLKRVASEYLDACKEYPDAIVFIDK